MVLRGTGEFPNVADSLRRNINPTFSDFVGQAYASERSTEKSRPAHFSIRIHHLLRTSSSPGWRLAGSYFITC